MHTYCTGGLDGSIGCRPKWSSSRLPSKEQGRQAAGQRPSSICSRAGEAGRALEQPKSAAHAELDTRKHGTGPLGEGTVTSDVAQSGALIRISTAAVRLSRG
ncbi:hypothetical protein E2562_015007 [Oryza meyeriana var. granulata]|uniref:Uncharacterized protein n=1 Tax=Oryza meyeriana var. granulata TaxID=110450 RepID=A0A6G1EJL6_9ORYZ|nr:hypothetical protein E2562_015007 [Oryza meyeriana var. granulata]